MQGCGRLSLHLLLMGDDCQSRHAIEYQGGAHHQGTASARDAVKKEALRRAGIGYHEVVVGHTTPTELQRLVEKLVKLYALCSAYAILPRTAVVASAVPSRDVNRGK